ncbi:Histone-lysine N-methyltransferase 2C [Porphyridium purpureum]|uniref:Histone-lysine N-methyltransferase 2C n=1 Tax=Porphyridium purpureum TaxID=35688 RepID=A0A5J4YMU7_PORPP|nr:Histone-lysine N-methyltransferase 2C [Porphyridium purpureum]|eukprot:POR1324..scf244_11
MEPYAMHERADEEEDDPVQLKWRMLKEKYQQRREPHTVAHSAGTQQSYMWNAPPAYAPGGTHSVYAPTGSHALPPHAPRFTGSVAYAGYAPAMAPYATRTASYVMTPHGASSMAYMGFPHGAPAFSFNAMDGTESFVSPSVAPPGTGAPASNNFRPYDVAGAPVYPYYNAQMQSMAHDANPSFQTVDQYPAAEYAQTYGGHAAAAMPSSAMQSTPSQRTGRTRPPFAGSLTKHAGKSRNVGASSRLRISKEQLRSRLKLKPTSALSSCVSRAKAEPDSSRVSRRDAVHDSRHARIRERHGVGSTDEDGCVSPQLAKEDEALDEGRLKPAASVSSLVRADHKSSPLPAAPALSLPQPVPQSQSRAGTKVRKAKPAGFRAAMSAASEPHRELETEPTVPESKARRDQAKLTSRRKISPLQLPNAPRSCRSISLSTSVQDVATASRGGAGRGIALETGKATPCLSSSSGTEYEEVVLASSGLPVCSSVPDAGRAPIPGSRQLGREGTSFAPLPPPGSADEANIFLKPKEIICRQSTASEPALPRDALAPVNKARRVREHVKEPRDFFNDAEILTSPTKAKLPVRNNDSFHPLNSLRASEENHINSESDDDDDEDFVLHGKHQHVTKAFSEMQGHWKRQAPAFSGALTSHKPRLELGRSQELASPLAAALSRPESSTSPSTREKLADDHVLISSSSKKRIKSTSLIDPDSIVNIEVPVERRSCALCPAASPMTPRERSIAAEDLVGPYRLEVGKPPIFVHYNCAALAPEVCTVDLGDAGSEDDAGEELTNVIAAYRRGRRLKCHHCHERGATIGCLLGACRKSFHRRCLFAAKCFLLQDGSSILCAAHREHYDGSHKSPRKADEEDSNVRKKRKKQDVRSKGSNSTPDRILDAPHSFATGLGPDTEFIFSRRARCMSREGVQMSVKKNFELGLLDRSKWRKSRASVLGLKFRWYVHKRPVLVCGKLPRHREANANGALLLLGPRLPFLLRNVKGAWREPELDESEFALVRPDKLMSRVTKPIAGRTPVQRDVAKLRGLDVGSKESTRRVEHEANRELCEAKTSILKHSISVPAAKNSRGRPRGRKAEKHLSAQSRLEQELRDRLPFNQAVVDPDYNPASVHGTSVKRGRGRPRGSGKKILGGERPESLQNDELLPQPLSSPAILSAQGQEKGQEKGQGTGQGKGQGKGRVRGPDSAPMPACLKKKSEQLEMTDTSDSKPDPVSTPEIGAGPRKASSSPIARRLNFHSAKSDERKRHREELDIDEPQTPHKVIGQRLTSLAQPKQILDASERDDNNVSTDAFASYACEPRLGSGYMTVMKMPVGAAPDKAPQKLQNFSDSGHANSLFRSRREVEREAGLEMGCPDAVKNAHRNTDDECLGPLPDDPQEADFDSLFSLRLDVESRDW